MRLIGVKVIRNLVVVNVVLFFQVSIFVSTLYLVPVMGSCYGFLLVTSHLVIGMARLISSHAPSLGIMINVGVSTLVIFSFQMSVIIVPLCILSNVSFTLSNVVVVISLFILNSILIVGGDHSLSPVFLWFLRIPLIFLQVGFVSLQVNSMGCDSILIMMIVNVIPLTDLLWLFGGILDGFGDAVLILNMASSGTYVYFYGMYVFIFIYNFISRTPYIVYKMYKHSKLPLCHFTKAVFAPDHKVSLLNVVEIYVKGELSQTYFTHQQFIK